MSTPTLVTVVAASSGGASKAIIQGLLVCLDSNQFLRLLEEYKDKRSPLVHGIIGIISKKHVYAFSVYGLVLVYCGNQSLPVTPDIEASSIVFPESWRCCK